MALRVNVIFVRSCGDSLDNNFETQLDRERQLQFQAGQTKDFHEGVTAFLEKRPSKFTGK